MTIILTNGLSPLELPDDLLWTDEFDWTPALQKVSYSITGALIIQTGTRQAGRPITLEGGQQFAWVSRATLETLHTWASTPGLVLTLDMHAASRQVVFRNHEPPAVNAEPIIAFATPDGADWYAVTLKFMEV